METLELPHNLDAEKSTLGSILLNRDRIGEVAAWLTPEMFYMRRHEMIYAATLKLFEGRTPPDIRLVAAELAKRGQLDQIGGTEYLSDLTDSVPTSAHITHYARLVQSAAFRRRLILIGGQVAVLGYEDAKSDDDIRAGALALVTNAVTNHSDAGASSLGEMMDELLDEFGKEHPPAISTGLYDLDAIIYGITCEGRLITIAGRPGHGKSALALTIALNVAKQGHPGLFFSMEMSKRELTQRALSMCSEIDGKTIQSLDLTDDEFRTATETAAAVNGWPLYTRAGNFSLGDIRTHTLQHIAEYGALTFIVVDYVGLVRPGTSKGISRQQQLGEITRGLKSIAMETHTDLFMLAQLNRDIEDREKKVPVLADLREAGDIEENSNIAIFVINPEKFDANTEHKGKGLVYVQKHRGGRCGMTELTFNAPFTRFDNCEHFREVEGYAD